MTDSDLGEFGDGLYESRVDQLLAELEEADPERAGHFRNALIEPKVSPRRVEAVMNKWGYRLNRETVKRWRANHGIKADGD